MKPQLILFLLILSLISDMAVFASGFSSVVPLVLSLCFSVAVFLSILVYFHEYYKESFICALIGIVVFIIGVLIFLSGLGIAISGKIMVVYICMLVFAIAVLVSSIFWLIAFWVTGKPHFKFVAIVAIVSALMSALSHFTSVEWGGFVASDVMKDLSLMYAFWCESRKVG